MNKFNPYNKKALNEFDLFNSIVLYISVLLAALLYENEYIVIIDITYVVLIILNSSFITYLIF